VHALSERLLALSDDVFHHGLPRPLHEIEALERAVGARFPDDYRAVLLEVGPFQVHGPNIWLILDLPEDVLLMVDDDVIVQRMPGVVFVGGDNGDYGYYYDPSGDLGRGEFALYFVDRGTLQLEDSVFVAATLTDAIEQVLAGENFRDRPRI
jgi:hypothetical protein